MKKGIGVFGKGYSKGVQAYQGARHRRIEDIEIQTGQPENSKDMPASSINTRYLLVRILLGLVPLSQNT